MTDATVPQSGEAKIIPIGCYVNEHCIGCGVCVAVAGDMFAMDNGHSKVTKQPATAAEVAAFKNAQTSCPVAAIIGEPK
jgi:ferredoxin